MKKRGVSLIVLAITIVIIVIITSAIVSTFSKSNTIENSNISVFLSNKESYQQSLKLYLNDAETRTFSNYSVEELLVGNGDIDTYVIAESTQAYSTNVNGSTMTVYKIDEGLFKEKVGVEITTDLPDENWYFSKNGGIYYIFSSDSEIPSWLYIEGKLNSQIINVIGIGLIAM